MEERYLRNIGAITRTEQEFLKTRRAAIIGCGGLGGYAAEFLARMGLGHITVIDGDVYAASNLNRQLNALETNLGKNKAAETRERLLKIRSDLSVEAAERFLNGENAHDLLKGHDVILDALDNIKIRLLAEKTACSLGIPLVHAAVEGWNAQISTVFPGDATLSNLYPPNMEFETPGVLPFTPAFCASIQACEAVKVLLNKGMLLRKKLLTVDLRDHSYEIIDL